MNDLLERAVAAHGGLDRWNKFKKVIQTNSDSMEAAERYRYQESTYFCVLANGECEYADAYNHSCLML
jgi:hypothetical protein